MTKILLSLFLVIFLSVALVSQSAEVDGKLRVTVMDTMNTETHLVVKMSDGTLATRLVNSLPVPEDTTRTLMSDLILTSALCSGSDLSPVQIQALLDNGYSYQDLIDFKITIQSLLTYGASAAEIIAAGGLAQDILDAGLSPLVIFNAGMPLDSLYGKRYEGGLIFYLDTGTGTGLVSAVIDQGSGILDFYKEWGCSFVDITGADGTAIGTGNQNSLDIDADCSMMGIAAKACLDLSLDGFDDWFLPSELELIEMYNRVGHGEIGTNANVGQFASDKYWSSSESNSTSAYAVDLSNGISGIEAKIEVLRVRAIRAF